jgi:hypothetical protein
MVKTREQLLNDLAHLAADAGESGQTLMEAALTNVLAASRLPADAKGHLISAGQHMITAALVLADDEDDDALQGGRPLDG